MSSPRKRRTLLGSAPELAKKKISIHISMNTNTEQNNASWGSEKIQALGPILIGAESEEDPKKFVKLEARTPCGAGGQNIYVVNRHGSRQITVTVRTRWIYEGQPRSQTAVFVLEPGADDYVGCTIPGPTSQRFDRDIVGTRFS